MYSTGRTNSVKNGIRQQMMFRTTYANIQNNKTKGNNLKVYQQSKEEIKCGLVLKCHTMSQ